MDTTKWKSVLVPIEVYEQIRKIARQEGRTISGQLRIMWDIYKKHQSWRLNKVCQFSWHLFLAVVWDNFYQLLYGRPKCLTPTIFSTPSTKWLVSLGTSRRPVSRLSLPCRCSARQGVFDKQWIQASYISPHFGGTFFIFDWIKKTKQWRSYFFY